VALGTPEQSSQLYWLPIEACHARFMLEVDMSILDSWHKGSILRSITASGFATLSALGSNTALAAKGDAPVVRIEGSATLDATGVYVSPVDNPGIHVDMPLNALPNSAAQMVSRRDMPSGTKIVPGAERSQFDAHVTSDAARAIGYAPRLLLRISLPTTIFGQSRRLTGYPT
jgi:hypothetical protein